MENRPKRLPQKFVAGTANIRNAITDAKSYGTNHPRDRKKAHMPKKERNQKGKK